MNIIKNLRKSAGLKQSEVADKIGVSRPTYSLIEKGEKDLTVTQLEKLADIFGVSQEYLISKENFTHDSNFVQANLPTEYGDFDILVWPEKQGKEVVVIKTKKLDISKPVLVRVHSECLTGDVFESFRCDCGEQKKKALMQIAKSRNGLLIYLRQEGRGIGLYEKIKTYAIQEKGYDTHEANIILGHKPDYREYSWVKRVLDDLKVSKIKLLTNNPSKITQITKLGIEIVERVPLFVKSNKHNREYFEAKRKKFKHFFGGDEANYFYQFSYARSVSDIEELGNFLQSENFDPLLKICIGIYGDHFILQNEIKIDEIEEIFKSTELYKSFVPVLHFSFKHSSDIFADIDLIRKKMPFVKYIQLNDVDKDYVDVLKFANKFFLVDFPITNSNQYLIDNSDFIQEIIQKKTFIMLDNSHGKGKKEKKINYINVINKLLKVGVSDIALYGGFGPGELQDYFDICEYFKFNFSIDSESKLKTDGVLDMEKVKKYFKELIAYQYDYKTKK